MDQREIDRRLKALRGGGAGVCFTVRVDPKLAQGLHIVMRLSGQTNRAWFEDHFIERLTDEEVLKVEAISELLEREAAEERIAAGAGADA